MGRSQLSAKGHIHLEKVPSGDSLSTLCVLTAWLTAWLTALTSKRDADNSCSVQGHGALGTEHCQRGGKRQPSMGLGSHFSCCWVCFPLSLPTVFALPRASSHKAWVLCRVKTQRCTVPIEVVSCCAELPDSL